MIICSGLAPVPPTPPNYGALREKNPSRHKDTLPEPATLFPKMCPVAGNGLEILCCYALMTGVVMLFKGLRMFAGFVHTATAVM